MKEPVDHIIRPMLPWRAAADAITECGYDATEVKVITREEFRARLKDMGKQRTAILTCMTCSDTARNYALWEIDPRQAMAREIAWEARWGRDIAGRAQHLKDELFAIADLIEAHRDEFDGALDLVHQRREWVAKKAEVAARRPKIKPIGGL